MGHTNRERRRAGRTDLVLKVEYDHPVDQVADYLTDLGEGGLFLCTSASFAVGERLAISISFPSLLHPVPLSVIVRWRRSAGSHPDESPGVGVELLFGNVENERQTRAILRTLLDNASAETPASPAPFRVLLVEDSASAQAYFCHAVRRFHRDLEEAGALEVIAAHDGEEAMALVSQRSIDLALVDSSIPSMTGDVLVRRMRGAPGHSSIPILVIDGPGEPWHERSLQAGADLCLGRKVMLKQLLTTLHLLVRNRAGHLDLPRTDF